jgi:hypothetical protein
MSNEKESQPRQKVARVFEIPPDALSCYSDHAQVMSTGNEVLLQFYETIPGPPGPDGRIAQVRTRLRATIIVSPQHAQNIGQLLLKQVSKPTKVDEPKPKKGSKS